VIAEQRPLPLIAATLVVFALGWIVVFCVRSEHVATKLAAASPEERRWIPLTIAVISVHVTLAQLLLTLVFAGVAGPAVGNPRALLLGMAVFVGGVAWWLWARRSLGPIAQFLDTVSPPSRLLVTGPFAVVRHPLALGTLLCALGSAVAAASPLTWVTFAACVVCLGKRCLQDEELLWNVFGPAYAGYAARTRRLVPFVW
jgi:protein-S-isoprenylcysteine O-methyltransferase Ste14